MKSTSPQTIPRLKALHTNRLIIVVELCAIIARQFYCFHAVVYRTTWNFAALDRLDRSFWFFSTRPFSTDSAHASSIYCNETIFILTKFYVIAVICIIIYYNIVTYVMLSWRSAMMHCYTIYHQTILKCP